MSLLAWSLAGASTTTALGAALIGGSYHFIAFANHRRRARIARAKT